MDFNELHALIPYAKGGKEKILKMHPYEHVTLALPGRHAEQTVPKGGDFVVMVTDPAFRIPEHQFTHQDIFSDVMARDDSEDMMIDYLRIIQGGDPDESGHWTHPVGTITTLTFLRAVQCLAVAEHRRYAKFENKFGGRYLPFRAAAGIAEGLWTAGEASERTRKAGRIGVEWLESERGVPKLTAQLMQ